MWVHYIFTSEMVQVSEVIEYVERWRKRVVGESFSGLPSSPILHDDATATSHSLAIPAVSSTSTPQSVIHRSELNHLTTPIVPPAKCRSEKIDTVEKSLWVYVLNKIKTFCIFSAFVKWRKKSVVYRLFYDLMKFLFLKHDDFICLNSRWALYQGRFSTQFSMQHWKEIQTYLEHNNRVGKFHTEQCPHKQTKKHQQKKRVYQQTLNCKGNQWESGLVSTSGFPVTTSTTQLAHVL